MREAIILAFIALFAMVLVGCAVQEREGAAQVADTSQQASEPTVDLAQEGIDEIDDGLAQIDEIDLDLAELDRLEDDLDFDLE